MEMHIKDGFKNQKSIVLPKEIISDISNRPLLKNLYITDIGFFPQAKYHYIDRKEGSEQNILIYCTNGEGYFIVNGKKQLISKNTLFVLPKNLPHTYGSSSINPWDIYWVHFKGELDNLYIPCTNTVTLIDVPLSNIPILTSLFDNIFEALSRGYIISDILYACQCFGYFLASAFYTPFNKLNHLDKQVRYVEETISFMEENLNKMLSLEDLTTFNRLSKSQLTQIFKDKTGYSPMDFFIRLKIQKACSYLDFTDLVISEVALKVGYSDQYYFSRIFKKIMSMSPSDYRKIKKG